MTSRVPLAALLLSACFACGPSHDKLNDPHSMFDIDNERMGREISDAFHKYAVECGKQGIYYNDLLCDEALREYVSTKIVWLERMNAACRYSHACEPESVEVTLANDPDIHL